MAWSVCLRSGGRWIGGLVGRSISQSGHEDDKKKGLLFRRAREETTCSRPALLMSIPPLARPLLWFFEPVPSCRLCMGDALHSCAVLPPTHRSADRVRTPAAPFSPSCFSGQSGESVRTVHGV